MGDKILLTPEKALRFEGYFDLQETYSAVKNYLEVDRYYDVTEKDFTEKNKGVHRFVFSILESEFFYTDYYKIIMAMKMEMAGDDVEIEEEGVKKIFTDGYVKLSIAAYGDADWLNKRSTKPIMTFLSKLVQKFHGKDMLKSVKVKANEDLDSTVNVLKQHVHSRVK